MIHFFPNSWDLNKKVTRNVDGKEVEELYDPNVSFVVEEVGKLAGQYGAARIVIEGHTDGSMKAQVPKSLVQELSLNRANCGEGSDRRASSRRCSRTSSRRRASAGTAPRIRRIPNNHAKNRRVEIKVYPAEAGAGRQVDGRPTANRRCSRFASPPPRLTRRLVGAGGDGRRRAALVAGHDAARTPRTGWISPVILPSPAEVVRELSRACCNERALLQSIAATLKRVLIGFGLAVLVGVPLGILAGSWRVVEAAGAPLALFGRNLPVAALIPLTILWFGIDETQKVMFIFIACVPFVYSDAVARDRQRARSLRRDGADARRDAAADRARRCWSPLALPDIYNSLRHLFGLAFGYIMLAELINARARPRLPADDEPAARPVGAHHPDPDDHRPARLRHRPPAVLVPARPVPAPRGRGVT